MSLTAPGRYRLALWVKTGRGSGDRAVDLAARTLGFGFPGRGNYLQVNPWTRHEVWGVLFDRDGTLVVDVPYNGDPDAVLPMPTARAAVELVRRLGVRTGVVSNQSGIGRGLLHRDQVDRVNARVTELLGPFDVWRVCPHTDSDGCECRKPAPGMVLSAAAELGIPPERLAVIGDIGADVGAARAAGAHAVLVPTDVTRPEEIAAAPRVAPDLYVAVRELFAKPVDRRATISGRGHRPGPPRPSG